jgi:hypothetical protein
MSFSSYNGGSFPHSRCKMTIAPQQRHSPVLSPFLRQYSGASPVCRHPLWRNFCQSAARPVFPAELRGDKLAKVCNYLFTIIKCPTSKNRASLVTGNWRLVTD